MCCRIKYVLLLGLMLAFSGRSFAQTFLEVETVDQAKIKVFPADKIEDADLCVYFVYEAKEVKKIGYWMEVYKEADAQIKLIFVDDPAIADFSVWIVDDPGEVGWRNKSKMKLLAVKGLEN